MNSRSLMFMAAGMTLAAFSTRLWSDDPQPASSSPAKPSVSDGPRSVSDGMPDVFDGPPKEEARRVYLGRVVAQPMSHVFSPWLVRPEREQEESVAESYQQLNLTKGMTVVDLGCGNGFWTLPMAKSVGPGGKVLAVDIQPEMLGKLEVQTEQMKLKNVELVLGKIDNPNLPLGEVDLLLMVDVYHEFSHPQSMLWWIRRSLAPNGVVALLEFRKEDPQVPIRERHKMSKHQIVKEYSANGFKLVREYNQLPRQHLMFFARDDSPLPQMTPVPTVEVLRQLKQRQASSSETPASEPSSD